MKRVLVLLLFVAVPAFGEIYTWTDARGTRHYTNSMYEVPERYRAKVKTLDLGTPPPATATPQPVTSTPQPPPAAAPITVVPEIRNATPPPVRVDRRRRGQTSGERDD